MTKRNANCSGFCFHSCNPPDPMEPILEAGMLRTHGGGWPEVSGAERVGERDTLIDIYGVVWTEVSNDHMRGESRKEIKESKIASSFLISVKTWIGRAIPFDTDVRNPRRSGVKLKKRPFHFRKYTFAVCKGTLIKLPNIRVR